MDHIWSLITGLGWWQGNLDACVSFTLMNGIAADNLPTVHASVFHAPAMAQPMLASLPFVTLKDEAFVAKVTNIDQASVASKVELR
jgi:hypothetical protein